MNYSLCLHRFLSLCGIIAPLFMIAIILIAGAITPGYSHIHNTVSKLAEQGAADPNLMIIGFIIYGVLIVGFSLELFIHLRHGIKAYITWLFITVYGISMILAGVFQDIPGGKDVPLNFEGTMHNAMIIVSCISFLIGMWAFAGSVYKKPAWFGFTWFTLGASFIGLILSIIFAVQSSFPASGLFQRLFYLVLLIWIEIISIWLFRLTFKKEPNTNR